MDVDEVLDAPRPLHADAQLRPDGPPGPIGCYEVGARHAILLTLQAREPIQRLLLKLCLYTRTRQNTVHFELFINMIDLVCHA